MKNLYLIFCLVICFGCKNQSDKTLVVNKAETMPITISIKIKNHTPGYRLKIFEPIGGNFNYHFLPEKNNYSFVKDTTIKFKTQAATPGCYVLQYEANRIILNLFPKDSVFVTIDEKQTLGAYNISGSNAPLHIGYNKHAHEIFFGKGFDTIVVENLPDSQNIQRMQKFIGDKTKYIDDALNEGVVRKEIANYFKVVHTIGVAIRFQNEIASLYGKTTFSHRTLFTNFYNEFNPYDTLISKAFNATSYVLKYIIDVKRDYTLSIAANLLDTSFRNLNAEQHTYDYSMLPSYLQESMYGDLIIDDIISPYADFDRKLIYPYYKQKFPNSPYIPLIDSLEIVKTLEVKAKLSPKFLTTDGTLKQLHSSRFKDKAVFIDLWATWCAPCIQEFAYKEKLDKFLHDNNIEMLYISMDEIKDSVNWKKIVTKSLLGNNHIIAGEQLRANLIRTVFKTQQWSIPRYVLLDQMGNIVIADAKRPSSEDLLFKDILDALPVVL